MSDREHALIREMATIVQRRWEADGVGIYDGIVERLTIEESLKKTNEQLRAALEEIASYVDQPGRPVLALIARQALKRIPPRPGSAVSGGTRDA